MSKMGDYADRVGPRTIYIANHQLLGGAEHKIYLSSFQFPAQLSFLYSPDMWAIGWPGSSRIHNNYQWAELHRANRVLWLSHVDA